MPTLRKSPAPKPSLIPTQSRMSPLTGMFIWIMAGIAFFGVPWALAVYGDALRVWLGLA